MIKNMNDKKITPEEIKKITRDLLAKIDAAAEITVNASAGGAMEVEIKTGDAPAIIGPNGETLQAIRHLLRVMARKVAGEAVFIDVDVNGYLEKRKDYLRQLALSAADDAALKNKEISLPPMNSYERRIVHMELSGRRDVATESRGCDADRRVVVKPA